MRIGLESFLGNSNIGLFGFVTDGICLVPTSSSQNFQQKCRDVFNVSVNEISLVGTDLIGVFCVGYGKNILVPKIAFPVEIKKLKELGLNVIVIDSNFTALGNNMIINEKSAVISPEYNDTVVKQIETALKIKVHRKSLLGFKNPGSIVVINEYGGLVHPDISDAELKWLEEIFELKFVRATVNIGSPFIKSGLLTNKFGVLVGLQTKGIELSFIQEGLGVVQK